MDNLLIIYLLKNRLILKRYELEHKYADVFNDLDKSSRTYLQKTYEYLESGIYRLEKLIEKIQLMK